MDKINLEADAKEFHMDELLDRVKRLEVHVSKLLDKVKELEARPQPAQPIGGAGNFDYSLMTKAGGWAFPWGTRTAASVGEIMAGQQYTTSVMGDNVSRETSLGPNGAGGPK